MKKEIVLKFESLQRCPGEEPQRTVTETDAEYYLRGYSHYIMFEEKQDGFTESTKGMLKIKDDSVELTKKGLINSHMYFEKGLLFASEYKTPFGAFPMDIRTGNLRVLFAEKKIVVEIAYSLESGEQAIAECQIKITIKEK